MLRPVFRILVDIAEVVHTALPHQIGQDFLADQLRVLSPRYLELEWRYLEGVLSTIWWDEIRIFSCSVCQRYLPIPAAEVERRKDHGLSTILQYLMDY
jgi:hypothetical protein